eukprot:scaffold15131_cov174-Amphora_coffeaeformis.AAC.3
MLRFPVESRNLVKIPSSSAARSFRDTYLANVDPNTFAYDNENEKGAKSNDFGIVCKDPSTVEQKLYGTFGSSAACECDYSSKLVNCVFTDGVCDNVNGQCTQLFDFWMFDPYTGSFGGTISGLLAFILIGVGGYLFLAKYCPDDEDKDDNNPGT